MVARGAKDSERRLHFLSHVTLAEKSVIERQTVAHVGMRLTRLDMTEIRWKKNHQRE